MSDIDYFLDLPSSPDPLADDAPSFPSSTRPSARRVAQSSRLLSSASRSQTNPRAGSRAQSPRKRTFELDVGDTQSPQRIRVTVEAEEHLKRDNVNRQLFPPSSARSERRREAAAAVSTTTTTVPLNDEAAGWEGDASTPQKQGRKRRTSNGTPIPRGRKRAGTPIPRKTKQARHDDGPSDAELLSDAPTDVGGEETPRPRGRPRKTPTKASTVTAVPSSQVSIPTTGRKRGRPRKVPLDQTAGASPKTETAGVTSSAFSLETSAKNNFNPLLHIGRRHDGVLENNMDDDNTVASLSDPPRRSNRIPSPLRLNRSSEPANMHGTSDSPTPSHQAQSENDYDMMSEDYPAGDGEPQSDALSEDDDGGRFNRQDTVADASDFSMIAVESLPSFQASFHASVHGGHRDPSPEPQEMGEETSQIINRTLDSLRRSLQAEREKHSDDIEEDEVTSRSTMTASNYSSSRPKPLPLSRQVFVGRGNVDDSFSTIPDSILHAATPGRLPMKQTNPQSDGAYDDSFSEIPEAVLEAATPKPARPRRPETTIEEHIDEHESPTRPDEPGNPPRSIGRRSSAEYDSTRLPTPEQTSSSNAGSKKGHGDDEAAAPVPHESSPANGTDVPSSPPARTRPRALDFGHSDVQQELSIAGERQHPLPPQQQPAKMAPNQHQHQHQSLVAPVPSARPSLSPIVRVGRTLQNVMSDNSSPEVREGNLGSPFRGPASSDQGHQSSLPRSPSPSIRNRAILNNSQLSTAPQLSWGLGLNQDRNYTYNSHNNTDTHNISSSRGDTQRSAEAESKRGFANSKLLEDEAQTRSHESGASSINLNGPGNGGMDGATQGDTIPQTSYEHSPLQASSSHSRAAVFGSRGINRGQVVTKTDHPNPDMEEEDRGMDNEPSPGFDGGLGNGLDDQDDDDDDDDMDIWDIEASRTSPARPEPARTEPKPIIEPDVLPPRRSKIPSPWRKTARRLIYKNEIASSSQIEVEENSASDVEQEPGVESLQPPQQQQPQQRPRESPTHFQQAAPTEPEPEPPARTWERTGQQSYEPEQQPEQEEFGHVISSSRSDDSFEEHAGSVDSGQHDDHDLMDFEEPERLPEPDTKDRKEHDRRHGRKSGRTPASAETSTDATEYSIVAQQAEQGAEQTPRPQEKQASAKSRFFGKFDLMSFFSSPAALPDNTQAGTSASKPASKPTISQPEMSETRSTREPREPPKTFWSTGLFPPILQKESRPSPPSPERRSNINNNMFPPGPALKSGDTVADTYDPSTSISPSPSPSPSPKRLPARSPSMSAAPSTPDRQLYPPIPQKKDFTPRPGESKGYLFTASTSQAGPDTRSRVGNNHLQEPNDEPESSALTEGSEYERVPPREKPSRWDRHASPIKSSFRSPLKPTTPGRIVSFGDESSSPMTQTKRANNELRNNNTNAFGNIIQAPTLRPAFEGKENQPRLDSNNNNNNKNKNNLSTIKANTENPIIAPPRSSTSTSTSANRPTASTSTSTTSTPSLSQTTWSKQHWAHLDEILQLRRRDPSRFHQAFPLPPRHRRRSISLLGKEVSAAQDARLVLESWHLEVVDAFKIQVGGWDERVLAKRLFALVVGEQKRKKKKATTAATAST
ncbi:hypothetical protein GGS20DRAFT_317038 [Poronia punctata]|nr:hypothetical protein GGS20DRAFT_317038 [Poronia punctata]